MPKCTDFNISYPVNPCVSAPPLYVFVTYEVMFGKLYLKVIFQVSGGNVPAMQVKIDYTQFGLWQRLQGGTLTPDAGSPTVSIPAQGTGTYEYQLPLNPNPNTDPTRVYYRGAINILSPCPARWEFTLSGIMFTP